MTLSEQLTYCTTKIVTTKNNGTVVTGTGFFMNFNINNETNTCQPVILTNNHVVENAKSIKYSIVKSDENNKPLDTEKFSINLDGVDYISHPNASVDLCAIPIAKLENALKQNNVKLFKIPLDSSLIPCKEEINDFSAMEEIIMIGYPDGLEDSYNNKPIIRRGITSTHVKNNYNNRKEFLIDMACFPGSSGSPIFICNENSYSKGGSIIIGQRIKLLGVLYAGPQHTSIGDIRFEYNPSKPISVTNIPNNLGIVIKSERIKELEETVKKIA